jgi:hypothetical protein
MSPGKPWIRSDMEKLVSKKQVTTLQLTTALLARTFSGFKKLTVTCVNLNSLHPHMIDVSLFILILISHLILNILKT